GKRGRGKAGNTSTELILAGFNSTRSFAHSFQLHQSQTTLNMARVFCDFRLLLLVAAVVFIYIQMRLFATQSQYADRLAIAIEAENHCTSQMRSLIDQISLQQGRIVALEDLEEPYQIAVLLSGNFPVEVDGGSERWYGDLT
ncbi:alpha-13-mannosyl-glycoprotein 2-beta-N-acetylglucosaminyltransferase, partial [Trifolium medium]|nr:alpha-13-mannosyl-glycoprotein 2-beta-N-acetylglucosaminyltransferase [Trifolium medium]